MYEYAKRAHAPRNERELYPICGTAAFSRHEHDDNPVTATVAEFEALPEEVTCWECRSIVG